MYLERIESITLPKTGHLIALQQLQVAERKVYFEANLLQILQKDQCKTSIVSTSLYFFTKTFTCETFRPSYFIAITDILPLPLNN